jgi:hypothetical protein
VAIAAEALLGAEEAGGWNRLAYPCFLLLGFVLAARTGLGARLGTRWRRLGAAGLLAFLAIVIAGMPLHERFGDALMTSGSLEAVAWRAAKAATGWLLVLAIAGAAIAGFAARRPARSPGPLAAYGQEAVLPVYLLHQTVAVVLAWWVLSWSLPAGLAWLALTLLTVAGTLVLYEGLRRPALTRRLLGLRPRHPVPPHTERAGPSASYGFGLSRT